MKMHDLLVYALTIGEDYPHLRDIVCTSAYDYQLEESLMFRATEDALSPGNPGAPDTIPGTPDIIVTLKEKEKFPVVIEIEADIDFDFADSLRQIKKYRRKSTWNDVRIFQDVRVIIPKICEKFAKLYKHEKFPVYLWSATRIWECRNCGKSTDESICKEHRCCGIEMRLKELKDVHFEPFEQ
jgi:hypothetical protein